LHRAIAAKQKLESALMNEEKERKAMAAKLRKV